MRRVRRIVVAIAVAAVAAAAAIALIMRAARPPLRQPFRFPAARPTTTRAIDASQ